MEGKAEIREIHACTVNYVNWRATAQIKGTMLLLSRSNRFYLVEQSVPHSVVFVRKNVLGFTYSGIGSSTGCSVTIVKYVPNGHPLLLFAQELNAGFVSRLKDFL